MRTLERKVSGELVVTSGNAPEVFESTEHAFDEVAGTIGDRVISAWVLAGWVWRNNRFGTALGEPQTQALGVVGAIGEQSPRARHHGEQGPRAGEIVGVAGGDLEGDRAPLIVTQRVDLVVRPPRERPMAWQKAPLLRRPPSGAP
jgi:hypothetical protein